MKTIKKRITNGVIGFAAGLVLAGATIAKADPDPIWDVVYYSSYDLGYKEGWQAHDIATKYEITKKQIVFDGDLPNYKIVVDKWWSYKTKLNTITKKQKRIYSKLKNLDSSHQEYLINTAYVETIYGRYGKGRPHQKAPRGLYQFKKSTAKLYGLYKHGKDYRGNTDKNIKAGLALKKDTDILLKKIGAPQNDLWSYLQHQQGAYGVKCLYDVYSGKKKRLLFNVKWDKKTRSIRKALIRNLTRSLSRNKVVKKLSDKQSAVYFVRHWEYVFEKAKEANAYMLLNI